MTLVRYECGCWGFPPGEDGLSLIFLVCDGEGGKRMTFESRDMHGVTYSILGNPEVGILTNNMARIIGDGYKLRSLKEILEIQS